jgi:hypothetical protein
MKEVCKIVESKMRSDDHPRAQREVGRPKMAAIIGAVGKAFRVTEAWIRSTHGNAARRIAAWLGWCEGLQRLRSIAAALRLASSGRVSDLVRQCEWMLHRSPTLQAKVDLALAALA